MDDNNVFYVIIAVVTIAPFVVAMMVGTFGDALSTTGVYDYETKKAEMQATVPSLLDFFLKPFYPLIIPLGLLLASMPLWLATTLSVTYLWMLIYVIMKIIKDVIPF